MRRRITVPGEERNNAPYDYGPWRGTQVWPAGLKRLKRGNYGLFANYPGAVLWCEALFEKIGCRKFALILEKPEIDENLPTPLSWDVQLVSTMKPIESSDFPKNGFRLHTKRGFWKVSAHLVRSTPRDFPQTCPEMMKK